MIVVLVPPPLAEQQEAYQVECVYQVAMFHGGVASLNVVQYERPRYWSVWVYPFMVKRHPARSHRPPQ